MGPARTSTEHGCLVRQGGCGWPDTTTTTKKTTAHSDMVAEPWLNVRPGWNVRDRAWTVAALGPEKSSRVDLMTGDLDVYVSSQDLELVEVRKSLKFVEIRRRLQDAEVELIKLRQSVPKSLPEPLVLRSGVRWLVQETPPEVDLSSGPRVPDFMET